MLEKIVLCDKNGQPLGEAPKLASHNDRTPLHLAFSCYVFRSDGKFLVTQRAAHKKVWPSVWTNSVCGHPAPGEAMIAAIERRLDYELGMTAAEFKPVLPNYRYKTPPFNGIIENEFCPVYIARATSTPKPNLDEVSALQWLDWDTFVQQAESDSTDYSMFANSVDVNSTEGAPEFSWWCKDQLKLIKDHPLILEYSQTTIS